MCTLLLGLEDKCKHRQAQTVVLLPFRVLGKIGQCETLTFLALQQNGVLSPADDAGFIHPVLPTLVMPILSAARIVWRVIRKVLEYSPDDPGGCLL